MLKEVQFVFSRKTKVIFLMLLSVIVLFLGFYFNQWEAAPPEEFANWESQSEKFVTGKIIHSRQFGILADYGVLQRELDWKTSKKFFTGEKVDSFYLYDAQIGLQGIGFSLLDRILPFSSTINLKIMYALNCGILALLITILIVWAYIHFNLGSALLILVSTMYNSWLTFSAKNLYWMVWTLFLPFIVSLIVIWYEEVKHKDFTWLISIGAFMTVFIKASCGYEFITSVLIAMEIPLIYSALKDKWGIKKYIRKSAWVGISAVIAFLATLVINFYQRVMLAGNYITAWNDLLYNIDKRTGFLKLEMPEVYQNSLSEPIGSLISQYINEGTAIYFTNFHMNKIVIVFLFFTMFIFISNNRCHCLQDNQPKLKALCITTWISFTAPFSWFILGHGHSSIHTHINYILWSLPSLLLIAGLMGSIFEYLSRDLLKKYTLWSFRVAYILVIFLVSTAPLYSFYNVKDYYNNAKELHNVQETGITKFESQGVKIVLQNDTLYYFVNDKKNYNANFYVHTIPKDLSLLSSDRKKYGYDVFGFYASSNRIRVWNVGEPIAIKFSLPQYAINSIRTGQFKMDGNIWETKISF